MSRTQMTPGSDAPKDRSGLRSGFTTGACSAAAAKAATRMLLTGDILKEIETTIPNGQKVTFSLHRAEFTSDGAQCSIIKDGGDDPDCTHGAEIIADVTLNKTGSIQIEGGVGVARVTKPGLGLEVGGPAINPVPRKNITEMVQEELAHDQSFGAKVTISVPDGEERAKKTLNARLGLLGGISILGTTGIVLPYSTAAFIASVVQAISLARARNATALVLTTGGRTETYAMKMLPDLIEEAFIQVGDYIGIAIKNAIRHGFDVVYMVGMMGKLSKMADGRMMTHASASEVNMTLLAKIAREMGAAEDVALDIEGANTARHVLEICTKHGLSDITSQICRHAALKCAAFAKGKIEFDVTLVDFGGEILGHYRGGKDK